MKKKFYNYSSGVLSASAVNVNSKKIKTKSLSDKILKIIVLTLLWTLCASLAVPVIWMIYTSFKNNFEYLSNSFKLPMEWSFENYAEVLKVFKAKVAIPGKGVVVFGIPEMVLYSLLLTTGTSFMTILLPALTSYAVSKYKFRGSKLLYALALVVMIIPIVGALPSQMQIYKALGIYDNLPLFILCSGGPFGFNFLLLYGAWKSLSWSYAEAASIDGAGHFKIMVKIMFPMMMPTLAALFILQFVGSWNDYMTPIIWLPSTPNLAAGMYSFQNNAASLGVSTVVIMAGFVLVAIPSTALFLLTQKIITSQLTMGGLKG